VSSELAINLRES